MYEREHCWSSDRETYHEELLYVVNELAGQLDHEVREGEVLTVWKADIERPTIEGLLPFPAHQLVDTLGENAFEFAGNASDDWALRMRRHEDLLGRRIWQTLVAFFAEHDLKPTFYAARNPREIEVRVVKVEDGRVTKCREV